MKKIYLSVVIILHCFIVNAQWIPAASLSGVRAEHFSANLPDGRVLVGGGWNFVSNLKTTEIYDPATDSWITSGNLNSAHSTGAAVTLGNGKVLAIGGYTGTANTTACELFDPVSETWTATGSLSVGRSYFTATVLNNGKVLVVGGYTGSVNTPVCELYDPTSGTWSSAGSLAIGRSYHTATLLNNGKVLVTGGYNPANGYQLAETEIYDPSTNSWSNGASMNIVKDYHAASKLTDGRVLVSGGRSFVGGSVGYQGMVAAEIYNPSTDTWSAAADLPTGLQYHSQFTLVDGTVLAVAGLNQYNTSSGSSLKGITYVYNPTSNTWTSDAMNTDGRFEFSAVLMTDTRVLVTGGNDETAETYGIASVINSLKDKDVVLYPNPVLSQLSIRGINDAEVTAKVFDATGRNVFNSIMKVSNGIVVIPVTNLASGLYNILLETRSGSKNMKFMVE